jgi:hypothetical protein
MLEYEGTPFVGMTLETQIVQPLIGLQVFHQRTMVLMACAALHPAFPDGMVRGIVRFYINILVTLQTKIGVAFDHTLAFVDGVAFGTTYFVQRMIA